MHRVHTLGSSFTNWVYPTWADYIQKHYDVELYNLAYGAAGNSIIKKKLYTIDKSDHVFIMFGGYHRHITGIDESFISPYIKNKEIRERFLACMKSNTKSWFRTSDPMSAFVCSVLLFNHKTSKFQDYYQMLENIYDCQNYLQAKGIDYNFSMWQGFNNDLSEIRSFEPKTIDDSIYMQNPIYSKVFESIDHDKFFQNIKKGLWEYMLDNKELVSVQNKVDLHPSTLCHFDFFKTYVKPILDQKIPNKDNIDYLYSQAKKFSKYYQAHVKVKEVYSEEMRTKYDRIRKKYFKIFEDL